MDRRTVRLEDFLPWLALLAAFSPVLVDLARQLAKWPADRVGLLAPLLVVLALRRSPAESRPGRADGLLAVGVGLVLELLGILGGTWTLARLGLPIAALGLARWMGRPPLVVIALLCFAVPPPNTLTGLTGSAAIAQAQVAGVVFQALGVPVEVQPPALMAPAGRIVLRAVDGGATLAFAFAALGWYSAAASGAGVPVAVLRAALLPLLALPVQFLALLVTGVLLGAAMRGAATLWLENGAWILPSALGLVWLHRRSSVDRTVAGDDTGGIGSGA